MAASYVWSNVMTIESKRYTCGYCGSDITTNMGYKTAEGGGRVRGTIWICHHCGSPTFFDANSNQHPGKSLGVIVSQISDEKVKNLYEEARDCCKVNAFTASVMCSRKLLMNIAVSKGANKGRPFVVYVNYLSTNGYVPPDGKEWVDTVREIGNMANHEIEMATKEDAEDLLIFMGMLLKFIYEFPETHRKRKEKESDNP